MIAESVELGHGVVIHHPDLVNLYGCRIGDETRIGTFVEIQGGAQVGARCKVSSHSFLCDGVTLADGVFIGHGVMFTNDRVPRAIGPDGAQLGDDDWTLERTFVGEGASIGSAAVIAPGVRIGAWSMVGAGAVVTGDVAPGRLVIGNPARDVGPARAVPDAR